MPCSVAWWCAWLIRAWCRAAQNGTQWDSAGLPWTGTRNLQRADLGDSVRTDTGRTEFRFHAAGMVSVQVSRYSDGLGSAVCKTVGLAYVGSNPTPATQNPRSDPVPVFPDAGSDACPGAVRQTVPGGCGPVVGQIWPGQRGGRDGCLGPPVRGRNPWTWSRRPVFPQVTGISSDLAGGFRSSCVPLSPAVARTHGGRNSWRPRGFLWASRGPAAGAEGLLDVLAGDLVVAGYAVGVGGEQDMHAVPGAGSDFGGRGAGGQPQRQRGMAKVVGAAHRPGACRPGWPRRGPGARSGHRGFR